MSNQRPPVQFNAFEADFEIMRNAAFAGLDVGGRTLHKSDDGRHLTIVTHYPKGAHGFGGAYANYFESFYVIAGTGRRIFPDGTVIEMKVGDAIYVRPGEEVEYIYDPGFGDIAFFWSDAPLPDTLTGDFPYHYQE